MIVGSSDAADRYPPHKPNSHHTGTVSITLRAGRTLGNAMKPDPVRYDALESRFHSVRTRAVSAAVLVLTAGVLTVEIMRDAGWGR